VAADSADNDVVGKPAANTSERRSAAVRAVVIRKPFDLSAKAANRSKIFLSHVRVPEG
jgi:hypothetical protein